MVTKSTLGRFELTMSIGTQLGEILNVELIQFTVEGMTESEWREMDDDSLKQTKSFEDFLEYEQEKEDKEIEDMRTRVDDNDPKWNRSIEDYKLKLKGFDAMTEAERQERTEKFALDKLKKKFAEESSKWHSTLLNKSKWQIATTEVGKIDYQTTEDMDSQARMDVIRLAQWRARQDGITALCNLAKSNDWDCIRVDYSGGHDSGGIDNIHFEKNGKLKAINPEEFTLTGTSSRPDGGNGFGLDENMNAKTMFGGVWGFSNYNPCWGPIGERHGGFGGSPSVHGQVFFYPEGHYEIATNEW